MKHKMWSRLLSMALAVMMIASIVPNSAFAEAASEITSTSQVQVEETPVEETQTPQEEVTVPEAETPAEPSTEPAPTEEPVAEPTAEPTVEPTVEPTQAPAETAVPSEQPSAEPTAAPEATEIPDGTAVPSETPAPSASPLPSESPVPSETPVPTETPEATEKPAIDGQALLDELMAIEDNEAFMKAVNELTEEQAAALEALGEEALAEYALRVESLQKEPELPEIEMAPADTYTAQVDNIAVTVLAPDGALPMGSQLVVEMVDQNVAAQIMQQNGVEYDGFQAIDVRFELNGEEVEPVLPVQVAFATNNIVPNGSNSEVYHFIEDEVGNVISVEPASTVDPEQILAEMKSNSSEQMEEDMSSDMPSLLMAAPSNQEELSETASVLFAFEVNSFSTFTITWTFTSDGQNIELPLELKLRGDDESDLGNVDFPPINVEKGQDNTRVAIDELVKENLEKVQFNGSDYLYSYAAADTPSEAYQIDSLNAGKIREVTEQTTEKTWTGDWGTRYRTRVTTTTYYYGIWYGDQKPGLENSGNVVSYVSYTKVYKVDQYLRWNGWTSIADTEETDISEPTQLVTKQDVYLVYEKQASEMPDYSNLDAIHLDKTIELLGGDDYRITLKSFITGTVEQETEAKPTDFVLVLDTSGSMNYKMDPNAPILVKNLGQEAIQNVETYGENYYRYYGDWGSSNNNQGYSVTYQDGTWQYYYGSRLRRLSADDKVYVSRIGAMKQAAFAFVNTLAANENEQGTAYRVAIVRYASNASTPQPLAQVSTQKNNLLSTIKNLSATGATQADDGLQNAIGVFAPIKNNAEYKNRGHVVLFFTDGSPTSGNSFEASVASGAVSNAKTLKASTANDGYGAKIYSIGIFDDADASKPGQGTSNENYFMHAVSSNYPNATYRRYSWNLGNLNPDLEGKDLATEGYYQAPDDIESLIDAFLGVADAGGADIPLDEKTVLKDVLSDYFKFTNPTSSGDIQVTTANFTGMSGEEYVFSTEETTLNNAGIDINGNTVNVSGFDFSDPENMVVKDQKTGKQLIIRIPVTYDNSASFGGNNIPSNTSSAGVYVDMNNDQTAETNLKQYPIPEVNRPLNYKYTAGKQVVYITQDGDMENLLQWTDGYQPNGTNNKFVNLVYEFSDSAGGATAYYKIPAGRVNGTWYSDASCSNVMSSTAVAQLMDCKDYAVTVTANPISDGSTNLSNPQGAGPIGVPVTPTKLAKDGEVWKSNADSAKAEFHVLIPNLTAEDDRVAKGTTWTFDQLEEYYGPKDNWTDKCDGENSQADLTNGTVAPAVNIVAKPVQGNASQGTGYTFTEDTDFILEVSVDGIPLSEGEYTVERQEIDHEECIQGEDYNTSVKHDFTIHVYATNGRLKITKEVTENKDNDVFVFKLENEETHEDYYYVVDLKGQKTGYVCSSAEEVFTLPAGTYTIEELPSLNYQFVSCNAIDGTIEIEGDNTTEVTFINSPKPSNIPTDNSGVKNVFDKTDSNNVVIWKDPEELGAEHKDNITGLPTSN